MTNAYITKHDALALLEKRKLYPNQLYDVLIKELNAKKILCLSDTTDVLLKDQETTSVAVTIERAELGPQIEIIQSDFLDFRYLSAKEAHKKSSPKFGAHLPQQEFESRREYEKIDSTRLKEDLSSTKGIDVILGRHCICACNGDGKLCGGIDISIDAQQSYLQTLIEQNPSLIVLSANSHIFVEDVSGQHLYIEAKKNLIQAITHLNANNESPYRFEILELEPNPTRPDYESGYTLIAYDRRKINFHPSMSSPQSKRQQEKEKDLRDKNSASALGEQKQLELKKQSSSQEVPSPVNIIKR